MFAHDDRGVYFNGFNKFITITNLLLSSTFTIDTWIKPQSNGTILGITQYDIARLAWDINGSQMVLSDEFVSVRKEFPLVNFYFW